MELETPTAFSLTKQINDFAELKDRQATFTNSFDVPKTKANVLFFAGLGITGSQSRFPYLKIDARIVVNSVSVVSGGWAIVKETSDYYKVAVYDGNIHLAEALGSKMLSELDLSSLNHDLTTTNFQNSFAHDYTDGYIYGIADFGNFNPAGIVINNQLPSFFVRWFWDKIFEEAGFEKDFEPENNLVITPKRGYDSVEDVGSAVEIEASGIFGYGWSGSTMGGTYGTFAEQFLISPNQISGFITLEDSTIVSTENHWFNLDITGSEVENQNVTDYNLLVFKNNVLYGVYSINENLVIQLGVGETLKFYIQGDYYIDDYQSGYYLELNISIHFYTQIGGSGLQVTASSFIGEMKQYDFVKDVMQHYGLISQKVKDEQSIQFRQLKDILRDTANAYDYSDKVLPLSETYETDYAQKNYFDYQYKNSDSEPYASGQLSLNNTTLPAEATQVKRPYNAPEPSDILLNDGLLLSVPFWEPERDDTGAITKWKVVKGKNYFAKIVNRSGTIYYKTENGTLQTYTGNYPVLSFQNLNYQTLLNSNYGEVQDMLNNARQVSAQVRMNLFEYDSFDLFKLLYSKQLGGYFYVNKLKWTNGKPLIDADLVFVPQNIVNTTVARAGVYPTQYLGSGKIDLQLDGSESVNYNTIQWVVESKPVGADNPTFSNDTNINPILTFIDNLKNAGEYLISLVLDKKIISQTKIIVE